MTSSKIATTPSILVCDDSAIERTGLAQFLRRFHYHVYEAESGQSAVELLEHRRFDLLILDLHMPGITGFEVLGFVRQNLSDLPVILLSGLPPDQIEQSCFDLPRSQMPPLLLKPVDLNELVEIVAAHLPGQFPLTESPDAQPPDSPV